MGPWIRVLPRVKGGEWGKKNNYTPSQDCKAGQGVGELPAPSLMLGERKKERKKQQLF